MNRRGGKFEAYHVVECDSGGGRPRLTCHHLIQYVAIWSLTDTIKSFRSVTVMMPAHKCDSRAQTTELGNYL